MTQDRVLLVLHSMFILLGCIALVLSTFLPRNFANRNWKKYEIIDKHSYIKLFKSILYFLGAYYILLGALLVLDVGDLNNPLLSNVLPLLICIPWSNRVKKYLRPIESKSS